jgi:hypothetical protein
MSAYAPSGFGGTSDLPKSGSARAIVGIFLVGLSFAAGACYQVGVSGGGEAGTGGSNSGGGSAGVSATGGTGSGGFGSGGTASGRTASGSGGAGGAGGAVGSTGGARASTGGAPGSTGGASVPRGTGGTAPIGIALPYSENFEDGAANGFVSGIDEEQAPLGTWTVVTDGGTQVYREQVLTSDPSWAVGGAYQWTDQHLETRLKIVSGAAEVLIAIAVRFASFRSYYVLEIRNDAVKIRLRTPAAQVDLVSYIFPAGELLDGTWYTFGLLAKGSALAIFFNDVQVATVMDATLASGGIAFGVRDGIVEFDDITVTQP